MEGFWEFVRVEAQFFLMGFGAGLLVGGIAGVLLGLAIFAAKSLA